MGPRLPVDVAVLRDLLARIHASADHGYTPAIHLSLREGHAEGVRLLPDHGHDLGVTSPPTRPIIRWSGSDPGLVFGSITYSLRSR